MGSFIDEPKSRTSFACIKRNSCKPAYQQVLVESDSRVEQVKTLSDICRTRYHGYSRWISRRAKNLGTRLRLVSVPDRSEICEQGRFICQEYIFNRLRKQNLLHFAGKTGPVIQAVLKPTDISREIQTIGGELEKSYPELYSSICKQLHVTVKCDTFIKKTFLALAEHMCKNESTITWGKVVALFALAGAFAQDCVQQGHPNLLSTVLETFESILNKFVASWIAKQGGWGDIVKTFRSSKETPVLWLLSIVGATVGFTITLIATTQL